MKKLLSKIFPGLQERPEPVKQIIPPIKVPESKASTNDSPESQKPSAFVIGGDFLTEKMFRERGWEVTRIFQYADLYVFTGGSDVSPELYLQKNVHSHVSKERDELEKGLYDKLLKTGAPMVGICRGGQFLNVMNGGTMWQHVDMHGLVGTHPMYLVEHADEKSYDKCPVIDVTSTHHQMMRPDVDGEILGVARRSTFKKDDQGTVELGDKDFPKWDTEIVYYETTNSLCFQPHPEYAHSPKACTDLFFDLISDKLLVG